MEKYKWKYWRPVVGIRNGSTYPHTKADCHWAPFGAPMSNSVKPQVRGLHRLTRLQMLLAGVNGIRACEQCHAI